MKKELKVELITTKEAKKFVEKNHYSKRWAGASYVFGLFENEKLVGVTSFGRPFGRLVGQSINKDFDNTDVFELKKFVTAKTVSNPNKESFLNSCIQTLRVLEKKTRAIITYSNSLKDKDIDLFKAIPWMYQGSTSKSGKNYIHYINGLKLCDRTCADMFGTISYDYLKSIDSNYKRRPLPVKERFICITDEKKFDKIMANIKRPIIDYPED